MIKKSKIKHKILMGALLAFVGCASFLYAEPNAVEISHTKIPKFDEKGRLVYQIFAGYARIKGNAPVLIRDMRVEYYKKEGGIEMTMESPKCDYDRAAGTAKASTDVKIVRDRMTVTGTAFEWDGTNQVFKIFNNAKVIIRGKSAGDQLKASESTKE